MRKPPSAFSAPGEREREGAAPRAGVVDPDAAAVGQRDLAGDGQPQAAAAGRARPRRIGAEEAVEDRARAARGATPGPSSRTVTPTSSSAVARGDDDLAALRAELDRVLDQVAHRVPEAVGVPDRQRRGAVDARATTPRVRASGPATRPRARRRRARSTRLDQQVEPALVERWPARAGRRPCGSSDRPPRARSRAPRARGGRRSSARRLTSSSARIAASGVRSSCEASATSRCCSSTPLLDAVEHRVERGREVRDLVAGARDARRSSSRSMPIAAARGGHAVDRAQRPARQPPAARAPWPAARPGRRAAAGRGRVRTERSTVAIDSAATATCRLSAPRRSGARRAGSAAPPRPELDGPGQLVRRAARGAASARVEHRRAAPPDRRTTATTRPAGSRTCAAGRSPVSTVRATSTDLGRALGAVAVRRSASAAGRSVAVDGRGEVRRAAARRGRPRPRR